MAPDQEAENGDRDTGEGDEAVAEYPLAREAGNHLADHAERWQYHDIHGRVRVEPEQVLEQYRIAAVRRVEDADVPHALGEHQEERYRDDGRAENDHDADRVHRPDEQRQPEPGQSGRPHLVHRYDKVYPREDRGEPGDEDPHNRQNDVRVTVNAAVRRVEGPAGIHASGYDRVHHADETNHPEVPAQQIEFGECKVPRSDQQRQHEVAERRGNGRHQEEEDHYDAVHRKDLIVGVVLQDVPVRRRELQPDHGRRPASEREGRRHGDQVEYANALMVEREQPVLDRVAPVEVARPLVRAYYVRYVPRI